MLHIHACSLSYANDVSFPIATISDKIILGHCSLKEHSIDFVECQQARSGRSLIQHHLVVC